MLAFSREDGKMPGNAGLTASTERTAWARSSNVEMGSHGQSYLQRRFDLSNVISFIVVHLHTAHQSNNLYEQPTIQGSDRLCRSEQDSNSPDLAVKLNTYSNSTDLQPVVRVELLEQDSSYQRRSHSSQCRSI